MHNSRNKRVYYLLLLMEICLTLGLGIFGNKIAERIAISQTLLVAGTGLGIILFFIITVLLLRYEDEKKFPSFPASVTQLRLSIVKALGFVFKRVVTVFPFALLCGVTFAFLCITVFPGNTAIIIKLNIRIPWPFWYLNDYDLVALSLLMVTLYTINSVKQNSVLVLTYALGFTTGFWGTTFTFESKQNNDFLGIGLIYVTVSFMAIMIRSEAVQGVVKDMRNLLNNITQER